MNVNNTNPFPSASGPSPSEESSSNNEAASALSQATGGERMGKQDFLKLLVTQLRTQDPMNPMKGQEFAAQLAQFSSVEQLTNIKSTLESQNQSNGLLSQSINSGVAADLLGKRVEASGNQIEWQGEDPVDLGFELGSAAEEATLTVHDEAGNVVYEKDLGALDKGEHDVTWEGTNTDGETAAAGNYTFELSAQDANGDALNVKTHMSGTVDRVTFGQDGILLWINGTKIPMGQVQSVEAS